MIESRCGLCCNTCLWKEPYGCGGCIETTGHPFHGECPIAQCSQKKELTHCGECDSIPCKKLYAYSYLDKEHGDTPPGERVEVCRLWAIEDKKKKGMKVLLTSAGFEDMEGNFKKEIISCFMDMLGKPVEFAKILFIPTAAITQEAKEMVGKCFDELVHIGIGPKNITIYEMKEKMGEEEALKYDVIYFTGGDTMYLLSRLRETGFENVVKKMVYHNKVYIGVSAGSIIATPNISDPFREATQGLCFVNAYLSVHCRADEKPRTDLGLPHICLQDNQALAVTGSGYKLIG